MDYQGNVFASSESENDISSDDPDLCDSAVPFSHFDGDSSEKTSNKSSFTNDMPKFRGFNPEFHPKPPKSNTSDKSNDNSLPFNPKAYGKGFNMLAKMGYKGGGLGKDGLGRIEPIIVTSSKGKQVDVISDKTSTSHDEIQVKFIDQTLVPKAVERWADDDSRKSDLADSMAKCENFFNNISNGKMVKLESSRTKGILGTLVSMLISQAQIDLVNAINEKRFEQQKLDKKAAMLIIFRDQLHRLTDKLDSLQSLLAKFNISTALSVHEDGQEIVASYLSNTLPKITPYDLIYSSNDVQNLYDQLYRMFFFGETKDSLSFDIKKRLFESHVAKVLVQFFKEWDVKEVEQGLEVFTRWEDFLFLSTLTSRVITCRIINWLNNINSSDVLPLHLIIHPWLPYFTETEELYTSLIKMFYRLVQLRCDMALPLIAEWHFLRSDSVGESFRELINYVREKFKSRVASVNISFDMGNFLSLVIAMFQSRMFTNDMIATDLSDLVIKYANNVKKWIKDGEIERIIDSYQSWSSALNSILDHHLIKPHFLAILSEMDDSTNDLTSSDTTDYCKQINTHKQTSLFGEEKTTVTSPSGFTAGGKPVNLFDYLSKVAIKKGIELRPKVGRMHDGKQVYTFGKVLIIVERLLIHAMVNKVWKPVDIPQLLKLA